MSEAEFDPLLTAISRCSRSGVVAALNAEVVVTKEHVLAAVAAALTAPTKDLFVAKGVIQRVVLALVDQPDGFQSLELADLEVRQVTNVLVSMAREANLEGRKPGRHNPEIEPPLSVAVVG
jgi:hypothetical protein